MKDLIIIGLGGLGRETVWTVERINAVKPEWNILGFLDDDKTLQNQIVCGYRVLDTTDAVVKYPDAYFVCAIGHAQTRKAVVEKIKKTADVKFANIIDPASTLDKNVKIGDGCIICANTYITVNIKMGSHVYIGGNATVGHDAVIGDFVTLYPSANLSGNTVVCDGCELGTGSQIIQGLTIGSDTIIGAGSVVVRDLPADCTAVGVPSKPIKMHNKNI